MVIKLYLTGPRSEPIVDLPKLYRIFKRSGLRWLRSSHQFEHPTINHCLAEVIVQMPHELLFGIELPAAQQLFDAFNDGTCFFAGLRIGDRSGRAALECEQQEADLVV